MDEIASNIAFNANSVILFIETQTQRRIFMGTAKAVVTVGNRSFPVQKSVSLHLPCGIETSFSAMGRI
jgi:hypothetical protein